MPATGHEVVLTTALAQWGVEGVRPGSPDDLVGGVPARVVLEPADDAMLSEMLAWAHRERLALVARGGGHSLPRSRPPARMDAIMSLRRLSAPVDHRPGDLTATLPAGASLETVNTVLLRERQWLPLDPPSASSTIGGLIATNDSGPRRQQHGTPRDLILGVRMVLADGRRAVAGGQVVKNVTGYDLSRMLCGSEGRLAVVTAATFKLSPRAETSRTVVAAAHRAEDLGPMITAMRTAAVAPSAVELEVPAGRLLVRFDTTPRAAVQQAESVAVALAGLGAITDVCDGGTEEEVWHDHAALTSAHEGALLKIALLPARVVPFIERLGIIAASQRAEYTVTGRAMLGVLLVRWLVRAPVAGRAIEALRREAHAFEGTVTLLSFPAPLAISTDLWDDPGGGDGIAQAVKARLDPHMILSPGRGPGGT